MVVDQKWHLLSQTGEYSNEFQIFYFASKFYFALNSILMSFQLHSNKIQKCDECGVVLSTRPALLTHIRKYHRAHKFNCNYCEKTFEIDSLRRVIWHFPCDNIFFIFFLICSMSILFQTHEESHTRHKTFQCKHCPKVFTVHVSLQTHTRRNHPEQIKRKK